MSKKTVTIRVWRVSDHRQMESRDVTPEQQGRLKYIMRDIVDRLKRDHPGDVYRVELIGDNPSPEGNDPNNRGG